MNDDGFGMCEGGDGEVEGRPRRPLNLLGAVVRAFLAGWPGCSAPSRWGQGEVPRRARRGARQRGAEAEKAGEDEGMEQDEEEFYSCEDVGEWLEGWEAALELVAARMGDARDLRAASWTCRAWRRGVAGAAGALSGNLGRANWGEGSCGWASVRGRGYLQKRIPARKVRAEKPLLSAAAVDVFVGEGNARRRAVSLSSQSFFSRDFECRKAAGSQVPFTLALRFQNPDGVSLVIYFRREGLLTRQALVDRCLAFGRFLEEGNESQAMRLKLIPSLRSGPWVARSAVPSKPIIAGSGATVRVEDLAHLGVPLLEMVVDVSESPVVSCLYNALAPVAGRVDVELALLVEAQSEDELPERLLGSVRLSGVSPSMAVRLP